MFGQQRPLLGPSRAAGCSGKRGPLGAGKTDPSKMIRVPQHGLSSYGSTIETRGHKRSALLPVAEGTSGASSLAIDSAEFQLRLRRAAACIACAFRGRLPDIDPQESTLLQNMGVSFKASPERFHVIQILWSHLARGVLAWDNKSDN